MSILGEIITAKGEALKAGVIPRRILLSPWRFILYYEALDRCSSEFCEGLRDKIVGLRVERSEALLGCKPLAW